MTKYFPGLATLGVALILFAPGNVTAQKATPDGGAVHLIVTVEPKHGAEVPVINRGEVMAYEGRNRDTVTEWIPAQDDHAALELFILIDDEASSSLGPQLQDIRHFISTQATSTKVGVGYMQNGTARIVQNLTSDLSEDAQAVRLPMGIAGANASPYFSVSDLIKHWPPSSARREVLMVSDGIDRYYGSGDLADPYLQTAIDDAARAGVVVSAIYSPGAGHFAHSYWQSYWGQLYLSELAEKTGGEAYYIGFSGPPVSFAPYLEDLGQRLGRQYLLSFIPQPQKKSGWQNVRISAEDPKVDLVSAGRVWVPAAPR